MDPFLHLPNEKIYEICSLLSNKDLISFMQTNYRISEIGQEVITKRRLSIRKDFVVARIKDELACRSDAYSFYELKDIAKKLGIKQNIRTKSDYVKYIKLKLRSMGYIQ